MFSYFYRETEDRKNSSHSVPHFRLCLTTPPFLSFLPLFVPLLRITNTPPEISLSVGHPFQSFTKDKGNLSLIHVLNDSFSNIIKTISGFGREERYTVLHFTTKNEYINEVLTADPFSFTPKLRTSLPSLTTVTKRVYLCQYNLLINLHLSLLPL